LAPGNAWRAADHPRRLGTPCSADAGDPDFDAVNGEAQRHPAVFGGIKFNWAGRLGQGVPVLNVGQQ
jgi:hypothetical protein